MRLWTVLILLAAAVTVHAAEPDVPEQPVTLSVQVGHPLFASGDWGSGHFAASADVDVPVRHDLAVVVGSGALWGARDSYEHDTLKLDLQYLGVGLRLTSQPAGGVRAYCLVEAALLHSDLTDEFAYFNIWGRTSRSSWDGAGLFGVGLVAGRRAQGPWWVFEVRGLVPLTSDRQANLPSLGVATVGVRFRL